MIIFQRPSIYIPIVIISDQLVKQCKREIPATLGVWKTLASAAADLSPPTVSILPAVLGKSVGFHEWLQWGA